jgi:hypothetical protein
VRLYRFNLFPNYIGLILYLKSVPWNEIQVFILMTDTYVKKAVISVLSFSRIYHWSVERKKTMPVIYSHFSGWNYFFFVPTSELSFLLTESFMEHFLYFFLPLVFFFRLIPHLICYKRLSALGRVRSSSHHSTYRFMFCGNCT